MVVYFSFLISPLASMFLLASLTCLLSSLLPSSPILLFLVFPFVLLACCFVVFGVFRAPPTPGSRSLPPCPSVFVSWCAWPPPKRCFRRNARIHTQGATHTHTQHASHTRRHADTPFRRFPLPHPPTPNTHVRAPARTQTPRTNERTHTSAHTCAHPRVRLHVLACVIQFALCVEQPCLHLGVRCCRGQCWRVMTCCGRVCHRTVRRLSTMLPTTVMRRALRCCCERVPTSVLNAK